MAAMNLLLRCFDAGVVRRRDKFDGKTKQKVEPKSSSAPVANRRDDAGGGRRVEAAKTVVQGEIRA